MSLQSHFRSANDTTFINVGDAIISSKTDLGGGSKNGKRNHGKVRNNKTVWTILPFVPIYCHKQQSIILRCFCNLKSKKNLFSNKSFSFIFCSKMIVHTGEERPNRKLKLAL